MAIGTDARNVWTTAERPSQTRQHQSHRQRSLFASPVLAAAGIHVANYASSASAAEHERYIVNMEKHTRHCLLVALLPSSLR